MKAQTIKMPADKDQGENTILLVDRFKNGDETAFDSLMEMHTDKLFGLAWGVLMDRDDALDVVQEVFIKLHKALPKMGENDNLGAWLYRVTLNLCIDKKRRKKRPAVEMSEEEWDRLQGPEVDNPLNRVCQTETGRQIRSEVEKLPQKQKIVFILRHYKLLTLTEISSVMGCSKGAVKAHLSRATAKLRDRLRGTVVLAVGETRNRK